ncbi:MAG: hypothetical protein ACRDZ7_17305 [Acidimicrobiia bacterium]
MKKPYISITNDGPSPFTEICLGFDVPPTTSSGQQDVRIGDEGAPSNIGEFRFRNKPVSQANPLPPGGVAWTRRLNEIKEGTRLVFDQVGSFGNGFSNLLNRDSPLIEIDVTVLKFDFPHLNVPGGRLTGTFRFVTER